MGMDIERGFFGRPKPEPLQTPFGTLMVTPAVERQVEKLSNSAFLQGFADSLGHGLQMARIDHVLTEGVAWGAAAGMTARMNAETEGSLLEQARQLRLQGDSGRADMYESWYINLHDTNRKRFLKTFG